MRVQPCMLLDQPLQAHWDMVLDLLDANTRCFLGNQPFHMLSWGAIWPYHRPPLVQQAHQAHSMESVLILCIRLGQCPSYATNYCWCQHTATIVFLWCHPNSLACNSHLWGAPKYMGGQTKVPQVFPLSRCDPEGAHKHWKILQQVWWKACPIFLPLCYICIINLTTSRWHGEVLRRWKRSWRLGMH